MRRLVLLLAISACAHGAGELASAPAERPPEPAAASREGAQAAPPLAGEHSQPAAPAAAPAEEELSTRSSEPRSRLIEAARHYLGRRFTGDCSGFVRRVFSDAEVELPELAAARSRSEALYRSLPHVTRPRPGDLAFFHATYNRDRHGTAQHRNRFTHVALVEEVDGARLTLIHRGWRGIQRIAMNLARPHDPEENGKLRPRRTGDRPGLRYLSGELFAGFASALDDRLETASTPRGERHEDVTTHPRGRQSPGLE
jgi:hypothetical protein